MASPLFLRRTLSAAVIAGALLGPSLPATPAMADGCQFVLGFKAMHDSIADQVGDCQDNQFFAANGDAQQHTAKGLLAWRKADNWTAFTNGYQTWVNGPNGIQVRLNPERFSFEGDGSGGAAAGAAPASAAPPAGATGCGGIHTGFDNACGLGPVDATGTTVKSRLATNAPPTDREAWEFTVSGGDQAVHLNVQDLWYDTGVQLWEKPTQRKIGEWLFKAKAEDFSARVLQFVKPQIIVKDLPASTYDVFVYVAPEAENPPPNNDPKVNPPFDATKGYTLRVALGPPVCDTANQNNFQLGVTIEPRQITQFSLMTFTAFIDPPYTDLYDFDWSIDGKQVVTGGRQVYQTAASGLSAGTHQVSVNARGVRQYPDPDQPFTPPNVTLSCSFTR